MCVCVICISLISFYHTHTPHIFTHKRSPQTHTPKTQGRALLQYRHVSAEVLYEATIEPTPLWEGPLRKGKVNVSLRFPLSPSDAAITIDVSRSIEIKWFVSLLVFSLVCAAVMYYLYCRLVLYGSRSRHKLAQKHAEQTHSSKVGSASPSVRHRKDCDSFIDKATPI
jgi:hypothetical protein